MNELIIQPGLAQRQYWRDIWNYRELFAILAWRDIAIRYKQTAIGIIWAVIRPLLTVIIFTIVFGRIAKLSRDGAAPYPIIVFAGMLPWLLFSTVFSEASNSLVNNRNLIAKVYFPRIIIPASTSATAALDLLINLVLFAGMMLWYRFVPSWHLVFLPVFIAIAAFASLGPSLFISALNVKYRDFRHVIPFVVQFGLYISPVGFSSSIVPDRWKLLYNLNPLVGVIDGFRWCILGSGSELYMPGFIEGMTVVILSLWLGIAYFRISERSFADLI